MPHALLLVDDEEKVLEFMIPFLRREGYEIVTAQTGKEALLAARSATLSGRARLDLAGDERYRCLPGTAENGAHGNYYGHGEGRGNR